MKANLPLAELLRQLKQQAKAASRVVKGTYLLTLEALCKKHGYPNLGQLERLVEAEARRFWGADAGDVLDSPARTDTAYRVKIGSSVWALRLSSHGPRLQLQSRPFAGQDNSDTSDLGLFQVIVPGKSTMESSSTDWVVSRYGRHTVHTLDFMSDVQVITLSKHFGIPFLKDFHRYGQQETSEMFFLKSPAFLTLRKALRSGMCTLPDLSSWSYGLTPLWGHLVGMSDKYLQSLPQLVDNYFRWCPQNYNEGSVLRQRLLEQWPQVPTLLEAGDLDSSFVKTVMAWGAKANWQSRPRTLKAGASRVARNLRHAGGQEGAQERREDSE